MSASRPSAMLTRQTSFASPLLRKKIVRRGLSMCFVVMIYLGWQHVSTTARVDPLSRQSNARDTTGAYSPSTGRRYICDALHRASQIFDRNPSGSMDSPYCHLDDIAKGSWDSDRDFEDYDNILQAYHLAPDAQKMCNIPVKDGDPPADPSIVFERIKNVAVPYLVPRGGAGSCLMHQTNVTMILKRLLRSPAGLTMVGDSISQYSFQVMFDTLASAGKGLVLKTKPDEFSYSVDLNDRHPLVDELIASAGVPRDRLSLPLLTFYRSDLLITEDQVPAVMGDEFTNRVKMKIQNKAVDWYPRWIKLLERANESRHALTTASREEPSLIILNSGAHWNVGVFSGIIEEEEFVAGYRTMLTELSSKIKELPFPVASYWRSLAPAQVDCVELSQLDNTRLDWASPLNGHMNQWNYQWYTWMNQIGRRLTRQGVESSAKTLSMSAIRAGSAENLKPLYLNVWDMSLKRPEAHLKPPKDCLHWCLIGVMNHWQQMWWHAVVEESTNSDYDNVGLEL